MSLHLARLSKYGPTASTSTGGGSSAKSLACAWLPALAAVWVVGAAGVVESPRSASQSSAAARLLASGRRLQSIDSETLQRPHITHSMQHTPEHVHNRTRNLHVSHMSRHHRQPNLPIILSTNTPTLVEGESSTAAKSPRSNAASGVTGSPGGKGFGRERALRGTSTIASMAITNCQI